MADYEKMKVPDLKKILQERGLVISGNKADLIARLQEDDKKASGGGAPAGEDEIDWDEDDKATAAPAAAAVAAGGKTQVTNPVAAPNQKVETAPTKTTDVKATGEDVTKAADGKVAVSDTTTTEKAAEPEAPKEDFSIGLGQTDAEKEAERRAARAKRFGIPENEESKKLADRAKKFGLGGEKNPIIKDLDSALPERRPKRVREEKQSGGRAAKRQTPDRRTEPKPKVAVAANTSKKAAGKVTDDPTEKAKAEARAKRFGKTPA